MIGDKKTPRIVLQRAYRMAVERLMVEVFGASSNGAKKRASEWWTGLSQSAAMKSGSFLHTDPIQIAAELNGSKERDLSEGELELYRHILKNSLEMARLGGEEPLADKETQGNGILLRDQTLDPRASDKRGGMKVSPRALAIARN